MDKIVLINDIIYLLEDRYEFKGMRRKPILKILYDCFFSSMSWAFLFVPLYTLLLFLIKVPVTLGMILSIVSILCLFMSGIYYERHRNVFIAKDSITRSYLNNKKRTLIIEYSDGKRYRVKICDFPSCETDKNRLIWKLKEKGILEQKDNILLPFDSSKKNHKMNLCFSGIGFILSLLALMTVRVFPHNYIIIIVGVVGLLLCAMIGFYSFYKIFRR